MNEYLAGFLLGLAQGLTEFLPVSSSGHLVLLGYLGVGSSSVAFHLALHLATLLAVLVVFRKDVVRIVKNPFSLEARFLLVATLPTAICAAIVRYFLPETPYTLPTAFMATTVLLLLPSVVQSRPCDPRRGWWKRAAVVGLAQGLACINGVSRSGATVSAGYLVGLGENSGKTSFLLSVPIIVGSAAVEALGGGFDALPVGETIVGVITAFSVGLLAIKGFLKVLKKKKMFYFAIYTFLLSIGSFLLLYLR